MWITYGTYVSADHLSGFANLIGGEISNYGVQAALVNGGTQYFVRGRGVVDAIRQSPRKLLDSYAVSEEGRAPIGLLYSPLWRIEQASDSSGGASLGSSAEGLIELPLVPGRHEIELVFDCGWPERCGLVVTFLSMVVVASGLLYALWTRPRI